MKLIREAKYLDRMGYEVPKGALNVTLQEDKYHEYVESLQQLLRAYEDTIGGLSEVELDLLDARLRDLKKALKQGFDPLNWNSLHIPSFLSTCNKALTEFKGICDQIHKSSVMIEDVISSIENTALISDKGAANPSYALPPLS